MTQLGVDLARLAGWLDEQGIEDGPIEGAAALGGGTQNIVVAFRRGGERFVLRRPPVHKRPGSDATMLREAKVLGALRGTDVPHPSLVATCDDLDVIGAAFYVMHHVEGVNPTVELPASCRADPGRRTDLALAVVDAAASIGQIDHTRRDLADLGRPDGYLERQVERWRSQLESYSDLPGYPGLVDSGIERIAGWLEENRPTAWRPGLIHGDFHMGNVLVAEDRPCVAAVIDWELTTIGDPLLDLAWLLATWPDEDGPVVHSIDVRPWEGFPEPADLVARYAQRSDRDLSALAWYEVLACFKLGVILEGTYARSLAGQAERTTGQQFRAATLRLLERAARRIAAA